MEKKGKVKKTRDKVERGKVDRKEKGRCSVEKEVFGEKGVIKGITTAEIGVMPVVTLGKKAIVTKKRHPDLVTKGLTDFQDNFNLVSSGIVEKAEEKSKKNSDVAGSRAKVKVSETKAEIAVAEGAKFEKAGVKVTEAKHTFAEGVWVDETEEAKAEEACALKTEQTEDICQDSFKSLLVGGCKKKTESKKKTEIKKKRKEENMNKCIAEKEALVDERRCYAVSIIEAKGEEIRKLKTGFEEADKQKASKLKELSGIDARVKELQVKVGELQAVRVCLLIECEDKDEVMNKLTKEQKKLEDFLSGEIANYVGETSQLEAELRDCKLEKSKCDKDNVSAKVTSANTPNLPLLEHIELKIEEKEQELECPVCFEVASVPILACDSFHVICFSCRPKV